jgi:hypothetical protein
MIELLNRHEILSLNKTFASYIINWQQQEYDPTLEHNKYDAGVMYDIDLNKQRHYSQEEVDQMNQERLEDYNRKKDNVETISAEDKYTGTIIYNLPFAEIYDYAESLSVAMVTLAEKSEWKSVIFLMVYPTPWLEQENDYKPVKKALDYLKSIGVTDDFAGRFKANGADLEELMKHLFWIFRCNASLPYCFFSGIDKDFVGSICKYGNIHFHFYSDAEMIETKNKALGLGMIEIEQCFENFSETSTIKGRRLDLGTKGKKPWWKFW